MPDYDFLNLSPPEFEELSRDLLQKELNLTLESFTEGRDGGIDLRHSYSEKSDLIIQCKRYKNYSSLLSNLKKEVSKAKELNPSRYVLTTSVGLTPDNKGEILKLFKPLIKNASDIFGKNDLNNLLGKFPEVENQHYKLWLSSTNILQKILNSKIYNQSSFEEEEIKETIKIYVENASFYQALDIIKVNNFVIISGIPGIGKTTLARVLVYYFLANDFDEFIFLSDSINEAYTAYKESTSQVFFFDDFLGRNFLDKSLNNNEEQRIAKFVDRIRRSKSKVLIFTTREYILKQAKQKYDVFEDESLEIAKCTIDLSQYTKIIRAKILYNHLYFSDLEKDYIKDLLDKESYLWIIAHRNFNPRLIETITNEKIWKNIEPSEYSNKIKAFLDNPEDIWKHVYENQISNLSKCLLAVMMSAGLPILLEDLKQLIQSFAKIYSDKYGITYSEIEFNKSIRELENTFIQIQKDETNEFAIGYQNPSVQDFLVHYFNHLDDFLSDIISSAIFYNQLFRIFSTAESTRNKTFSFGNKIFLKEKHRNILVSKLLSEFDSLTSSVISRVHYKATNSFRWIKKSFSVYEKLNEIIQQELHSNSEIKKFIVDKFREELTPKSLKEDEFSSYIQLLKLLKDNYEIDRLSLIEQFSSNIQFTSQIRYLIDLEEIYPNELAVFTQTNHIMINHLLEIIEEDIDYVDLNEIEDFNSEAKVVLDYLSTKNNNKEFKSRVFDIEFKLEEKLTEKSEYDDYQYDRWKDSGFPNTTKNTDETSVIKDIFGSLNSKIEND